MAGQVFKTGERDDIVRIAFVVSGYGECVSRYAADDRIVLTASGGGLDVDEAVGGGGDLSIEINGDRLSLASEVQPVEPVAAIDSAGNLAVRKKPENVIRRTTGQVLKAFKQDPRNRAGIDAGNVPARVFILADDGVGESRSLDFFDTGKARDSGR